MRKLKLFALLLGLFTLMGVISLKAAPTGTPITIKYVVNGVEREDLAVAGNASLGTLYNPDKVDIEDATFLFWIVNGAVRRDLKQALAIKVPSTLDLVAYYGTTGEKARVFLDSNLKLLSVSYLSSDVVEAPSAPSKPLSTHLGWALIDAYEGALITDFNLTEESPLVTYYVARYSVSADAVNVTFNGTTKAYPVNSVITLESSSGYSVWKHGDMIIGYGESLSFTVLETMTITTEVTSPVTEYVTLRGPIALRDTHNSYIGRFDVGTKEVIDFGFVLSDDSKIPSSSLNVDTNEFLASFTGSYNVKGAYVTYLVDGVTTTITSIPELEVNTYEVLFDVDGGSEVMAQTIEENGLVVEPEAPTKDGYVFEGWFKDAAFSEAWNFEVDTVTSNITLYAKFVVQVVKLPAPVNGMNVSPRPDAHIAIGVYAGAGGENGGFVGFGLIFTNNTTSEVFIWNVAATWGAGFAIHYREQDLEPAGIVLTPGHYTLSFYARGNGITTSDSDESSHTASFSIEKPPLAKPTLSISDGELTWADVEHATSYEVYINDELQVGNESPFDLSVITEPGIYQIKVVALADTHKSSEATIEYVVSNPEAPALDTPTNLVQDGFNLTWNAVEHAVGGYSITINDITKNSQTNAFDLSEFDLGDQTVTVSVVALGDATNYSNSLAAEKEVTLGTLLPRLNPFTAGDHNGDINNGFGPGNYRLLAHLAHAPFQQADWSGLFRFIVKQGDDILGETTGPNDYFLHKPGVRDDFYGSLLTHDSPYTLEISLIAAEGSGHRDSLPLVIEFTFNDPEMA